MNIFQKKHVITYIDLLGTKERIKKDQSGIVLNILANLYYQATKAFTQDIKEEQLKMKIFSDNIIIARELPSNQENAVLTINQMVGVASCLQFMFLIGRWPTRGGLTVGDLYIDNTFVWGDGLVRAYELESKIAVFPRIVIDPKIDIPIFNNSVHSWRYDGGLPIVDTFSIMHDDNSASEIKEAILELRKETNEYTVGKIEWIVAAFNKWCNDNHFEDLLI